MHTLFALSRLEQDWSNAPDRRARSQPFAKKSQIALWLCLSTLCRIGELLQAEWKHIDLDKGIWFIPREKPLKDRAFNNSLVLAGGENKEWTPHDLRRTGATIMQGLGVSLDIIDRCQNHVLAGSRVRRVYLRHDYEAEKPQAWRVLGDKLDAILSGSA